MEEQLLQAVIAVLAIANPLGAAPMFVGLTEDMSADERRAAALRATIAVFAILATAGFVGRWVLLAFGISLPAFQAAGGLVITLMGLEMLRGTPSPVQHDRSTAPATDDPIVIPLAMPLIAGPGAITTVITLTARLPGWRGQVYALVAAAVTAGVLLVMLQSSSWLAQRVGERGQRIFLRFMGLILLSIGAQLMMTGARTFFTTA